MSLLFINSFDIKGLQVISNSIQSSSFLNITISCLNKKKKIIVILECKPDLMQNRYATGISISSWKAALLAKNGDAETQTMCLCFLSVTVLTWRASYSGSLLIWQNDMSGWSNTRLESDSEHEECLKEEMKSGCRMINMTALSSVFPFFAVAQLGAGVIYEMCVLVWVKS